MLLIAKVNPNRILAVSDDFSAGFGLMNRGFICGVLLWLCARSSGNTYGHSLGFIDFRQIVLDFRQVICKLRGLVVAICVLFV